VDLDEYGIPLEVGRQLESVLHPEGNLDNALARLRELDVQATGLSPFEKELVSDAKAYI